MNHATRKMRFFARRLIAQEEQENPAGSTRSENRTTVAVVRKLRPQLEELMGNTGYRALLARALALAREEVPWLDAVRMGDDGGLEDIEETPEIAAPGKQATGGSVMLAWLFGLLASFIGENLTVQLVLEVWPDLSLNGYFSQDGDHEKTT